jgi:hypothetical protein
MEVTPMQRITRSVFFLMVFLMAAALRPAWSITTCQGGVCTAQVNFQRFAQTAFQQQNLSQWCWAAAISMVYSYHGYTVSQARIVSDAYGSVVNMPAVAGSVMAQSLNRPWVDDFSRPFTAHLSGAYDPFAGVFALDNNRLLRELDQGRPFILGTDGHAVVVTAMQYAVTPFGPQILSVGVFDPWPGRGARSLSVAEMTPITNGGALSFAATVDVQSSTGSLAQSPFSGTGGGSFDLLSVLFMLALVIASWVKRRR